MKPNPVHLLAAILVLSACLPRLGIRVPGIGIQIFADEGSDAEIRTFSQDVRSGETLGTVRGQDLHVAEGQLWIGGQSFGPVTEGSIVEITPHAVFVDGHRRGELPSGS